MKLIEELVGKLSNVEVRGSLKKYNLDNENPKKEQEQLSRRISIKGKLAEKKP